MTVTSARIDEDYLDAIGISVVRGRAFRLRHHRRAARGDRQSRPGGPLLARGDPIGKRFRLAGPGTAWTEIVGVAADAKFRCSLRHPPRSCICPGSRILDRQHAHRQNGPVEPAAAALVRTAILETDRDVPILWMRTMEAFYNTNSKNLNTVIVRTIAGMGTLGLALALIGLYGLTVYAVSRRTREIGIRMAMGARPASVLRMVLRQGVLPSLAGIGLGVLASIAVGGVIEGVFPNTGGDALTFLLIVPGSWSWSMLAAYVPASARRRSIRWRR